MMDESTITKLVDEAISAIPGEYIYDMALKYVNLDALQSMPDLTQEELCANMAGGGFIAGIRFTLEHIEIHPKEPGADEHGDHKAPLEAAEEVEA